MAEQEGRHSHVRYEVDGAPPPRIAATLGAQSIAFILAGIVLTPIVVLRAAGVEEGFAPWVVFMAMLVIVASSLMQFPLAHKLSLLRRVITPAVSGTVIMLISVTVMPIAFSMLAKILEGATIDPADAPVSTGVTLAVILAISVFGSRRWRLWSPLFGVLIGYAVAAPFGILDGIKLAAAPWIGLPSLAWPGLDLAFGPAFWELLPTFLIAALIGAIETFGDGIAIQRVSW